MAAARADRRRQRAEREARARCPRGRRDCATLTAATAARGARARARASCRTSCLMDLRLPDLDGGEAACSRLKDEPATARIPVVALSARSAGDARAGCARPASPVASRSRSTSGELPAEIRRLLRAAERKAAPGRIGCWRPGRLAPAVRHDRSRTARARGDACDAHACSRACAAGWSRGRSSWPAAAVRARASSSEATTAEGGQPLRDRPDRGEVPPGHDSTHEPQPDDVALRPRRGLQRRPRRRYTGKAQIRKWFATENKAFMPQNALGGRHPVVQDQGDRERRTRGRCTSSATTSTRRRKRWSRSSASTTTCRRSTASG